MAVGIKLYVKILDIYKILNIYGEICMRSHRGWTSFASNFLTKLDFFNRS
jgi:hypothetical protein